MIRDGRDVEKMTAGNSNAYHVLYTQEHNLSTTHHKIRLKIIAV